MSIKNTRTKGGLYVLKHVIYNTQLILECCRAVAMHIEYIIVTGQGGPPGNQPP